MAQRVILGGIGAGAIAGLTGIGPATTGHGQTAPAPTGPMGIH